MHFRSLFVVVFTNAVVNEQRIPWSNLHDDKKRGKTPQVHVRVRVREPIRTGSGKFRYFSGFPVSDSGSEWVVFSGRKMSTG